MNNRRQKYFSWEAVKIVKKKYIYIVETLTVLFYIKKITYFKVIIIEAFNPFPPSQKKNCYRKLKTRIIKKCRRYDFLVNALMHKILCFSTKVLSNKKNENCCFFVKKKIIFHKNTIAYISIFKKYTTFK